MGENHFPGSPVSFSCSLRKWGVAPLTETTNIANNDNIEQVFEQLKSQLEVRDEGDAADRPHGDRGFVVHATEVG